MNRIKINTKAVKNVISAFTKAEFEVITTDASITIVCDKDTVHKAIQILSTLDLTPLTYQINEDSQRIELFDSRL